MARDYYDVLGIKKDASLSEIKGAYRELALKFHPDRNSSKDSEEKFKEINEAYAVLSDPEKRKQYDMFGPEQFNKQYSTDDIFRNFDFESVFRSMGFDFGGGFGGDDFFDSMFGFNPRGGNSRGNDILARMSISLKDAAHGTRETINVRRIAECDKCKGSGGEPGTGRVKCEVCNGSGQLRMTQRTPFGVIQTINACRRCGGSGSTLEKPCKKCSGTGAVQRYDKIEVSIPKGVMNGSRLRLKGMGDHGKGGNGDLYMDVTVKEDRNFKREGDNLHTKLHIPLHTALLGGDISVHTLDGNETVRVSEGTQNNSSITLKGKGMPHFMGSGSGDEVVEIIVDIPKKLSKEQKELVKKLADLDNDRKKWFGII